MYCTAIKARFWVQCVIFNVTDKIGIHPSFRFLYFWRKSLKVILAWGKKRRGAKDVALNGKKRFLYYDRGKKYEYIRLKALFV